MKKFFLCILAGIVGLFGAGCRSQQQNDSAAAEPDTTAGDTQPAASQEPAASESFQTTQSGTSAAAESMTTVKAQDTQTVSEPEDDLDEIATLPEEPAPTEAPAPPADTETPQTDAFGNDEL